MDAADLVGTWSLNSYRLVGSRGRARHPYGEEPFGLLIYAPDGFMSVAIMNRERAHWAGTDIRRQTDGEAADATRTFLSYCGTYEVLSDRVVHRIRASLFPNWTGTEQERFYRLEHGCLELSTSPFDPDCLAPRAYLVWKRTRS